jgi:AcrR family transcriptional regulator
MIARVENTFATNISYVFSDQRPQPMRSDSRRTQIALIDAIGAFVRQTGTKPERLAELASFANISLATVYRHFASVDELVQAHIVQLPQRAAQLFEGSAVHRREVIEHQDRLHAWNQSWIRASLEFGPTAVYLRSAQGFLARRASKDPTVEFVCAQVIPLLKPFATNQVAAITLLTTWNAISDPREILDLKATARWSSTRIADYITNTTLASAGEPRATGEPRGVPTWPPAPNDS